MIIAQIKVGSGNWKSDYSEALQASELSTLRVLTEASFSTFKWSISGPNGSNVVFTDSQSQDSFTQNPTFSPDIVGRYVISCIVDADLATEDNGRFTAILVNALGTFPKTIEELAASVASQSISGFSVVEEYGIEIPPVTPVDGGYYILGTTPTGVWAGNTGKIAKWSDSQNAYTFYTPVRGDSFADKLNARRVLHYTTIWNVTWLVNNIEFGYITTHASRHLDGSDDIALATTGSKGVMSAADKQKLDNIVSPLEWKGAIASNTDFPLIADVTTGWFYKITADVTDNAGVAFTNTGQVFRANAEIAWDGDATLWVEVGPKVTFEELDANGDVGTGATQVAQGDHGHPQSKIVGLVTDLAGKADSVDEIATLYVGKHGNDANDGKQTWKAFETFQAAIDAAVIATGLHLIEGTDSEIFAENLTGAAGVNIDAPNATLQGVHTIANGNKWTFGSCIVDTNTVGFTFDSIGGECFIQTRQFNLNGAAGAVTIGIASTNGTVTLISQKTNIASGWLVYGVNSSSINANIGDCEITGGGYVVGATDTTNISISAISIDDGGTNNGLLMQASGLPHIQIMAPYIRVGYASNITNQPIASIMCNELAGNAVHVGTGTATVLVATDVVRIPTTDEKAVIGDILKAGFVDASAVSTFFDARTKTYTVTGTNFEIFAGAKSYTKNTESIVGDGTDFTLAEGAWFVYYDGVTGALTASQTTWDILTDCLIGAFGWDSTNEVILGGGDFLETHGSKNNPVWHKNAHLTRGMQLGTGLNVAFNDAGDGDTDSHAQVAYSEGTLIDEDLYLDIVRAAVPSADLEMELGVGSGATITTPARMIGLYRLGVNGDWRMKTVPVITTQTTVSAVVATDKFQDSGSGFTDIVAGDMVLVSGFVNAKNNGAFRVSVASAAEISVNLDLVDEAAGPSVTVTRLTDEFPMMQSGASGYTGGSGRLAFNEFTGGVWTLTECANRDFVASFIVGLNHKKSPLFWILGQREDATLSDALENNSWSALQKGALPTPEIKPLDMFLAKTSAAYTNSVSARFRAGVSLRAINQPGNGGAPTLSSHNSLSGRSDPSCHPLSAISNDSNTVSGETAKDALDFLNLSSD